MKIVQLIDSLEPGGAERMAVHLANGLNENNESFLCASRKEGLLKGQLNEEVTYLFLERRKTFDRAAINKFKQFVSANQIAVVHAHSSSYLFAVICLLLGAKYKIVWHNHFGNSVDLPLHKMVLVRFCSRWFSAVITVNDILKDWAINQLKVKPKYISYLPNFIVEGSSSLSNPLPGTKGSRVLCLANFRQEKGHLNLLKAFEKLLVTEPRWDLILVGKFFNNAYEEKIKDSVKSAKLSDKVFFMGERSDTTAIIAQCDIGVLSSSFEGLPLALLEYGLGGLPVIVTKVGEIPSLINHGEYGKLIEPGNVQQLVDAFIEVINKPDIAKSKALAFQEKVRQEHGVVKGVERVSKIYQQLDEPK